MIRIFAASTAWKKFQAVDAAKIRMLTKSALRKV